MVISSYRSRMALLRLWGMLMLLATLSFSPTPAIAQQSEETTPVETYILDQIKLNGPKLIDLRIRFPAEKDRIVRTDFLEELLGGSLVDISRQGIAISGMVINESLDLQYMNFPSQLVLEKSVFKKDVNLCGSHFLSLKLSGSYFDGDFLFRFVTVENELWINDATFRGNIDFFWTTIGGLLLTDNAVFPGEANFNQLRVDGYFLARHTQFKKLVNFSEMKIGELLNVSYAHFDSFASFALTEADNLNIDYSHFRNDIELNGAEINHILSCSHTNFDGAVDARGLRIGEQIQCMGARFTDPEQIVDFRGVQSGVMMFQSSSFAGGADFSFGHFSDWVNFNETIFRGPVTFTSSGFTGDLKFIDASFEFPNEPADFRRIRAEGHFQFLNARFTNGLDLSYGDMKDISICGKQGKPARLPVLQLRLASIGRELSLDHLFIGTLEADSLTVLGPATIGAVEIKDRVNLKNSNFKSLSIALPGFQWPENKDAFQLGGITFQDVKISGDDLSEDSWRSILRLYNQSSYSPLAYKTFIQLLRDKGKPEWANEVELTMKRRERDEVLTPLSASWFWSWFIDLFSGYGKRPYLALIWSALVIAVGVVVYYKKENMILVDGDPSSLIYNPFWYSLALFVPFVELDITEAWKPSPFRKWAYFYRYIHQLFGWILTPIALLVFSGVIK